MENDALRGLVQELAADKDKARARLDQVRTHRDPLLCCTALHDVLARMRRGPSRVAHRGAFPKAQWVGLVAHVFLSAAMWPAAHQ